MPLLLTSTASRENLLRISWLSASWLVDGNREFRGVVFAFASCLYQLLALSTTADWPRGKGFTTDTGISVIFLHVARRHCSARMLLTSVVDVSCSKTLARLLHKAIAWFNAVLSTSGTRDQSQCAERAITGSVARKGCEKYDRIAGNTMYPSMTHTQ